MTKELPIQIVELRQNQDDFKPEGGGGNQLPQWVTDTVVKQNGICWKMFCLNGRMLISRYWLRLN